MTNKARKSELWWHLPVPSFKRCLQRASRRRPHVRRADRLTHSQQVQQPSSTQPLTHRSTRDLYQSCETWKDSRQKWWVLWLYPDHTGMALNQTAVADWLAACAGKQSWWLLNHIVNGYSFGSLNKVSAKIRDRSETAEHDRLVSLSPENVRGWVCKRTLWNRLIWFALWCALFF